MNLRWRKRIAPAVLSLGGITVLATVLATAVPAGVVPSTVAGKTFDFWVTAYFNPGGSAPFHDCARFTATTMSLDGCGSGHGALHETPLVQGQSGTLWVGTVPCGGLNLQFIGTSVDGAHAVATMGGIGYSTAQQNNNYGVGGGENGACTLATPAAQSNPYRKPD